ncbi:MAG: dipeptidase [Treponema sp.]|nr:dipeptidase [Treponema sp.]
MAYKVVDLHCDSVSLLMEGKDLRQPVPNVHVDLPRLRKGGVGLQVFAVYVPPETDAAKAFDFTCERLDTLEKFIRSDDLLCPVVNSGDLKSALERDKTGIMLAVENGLAIEGSLEKLEQLRRRNVRIMTLVHSKHLPWVASCTGDGPFDVDGDQNRGLNAFGGQVIDAMNDLGIIPDVSHSSETAFWDIIRRSNKPVIASHSCAYSICSAPRNLRDDQLKALGTSGGLAGVNFYSAFLSQSFRDGYTKSMRDEGILPDVRVPYTIIADHIDYMVNIAGEDAVALGSDFDGIHAAPDGVTGSDFYPVLETELRSRGYTDKRIEKIFNLNFARVLREWD